MKKTIAWRIFIPSASISFIAAMLMIFIPDKAKSVIDKAFYFLTHEIGWIL